MKGLRRNRWLMFVASAATPLLSVHAKTSLTPLDEPFQSSFARLSHAACVSLYHRNGRIGCSTASRSVQTGRLEYYDGSTILGSSGEAFVAVLEDKYLTANNINNLISHDENGNLKGILIINATKDSSDDAIVASPAPQTPQGAGTPSEKLSYGNIDYVWNTYGDGLELQDLYGYPMAYIASDEVSDYLKDVAQSSNAESDIVAEFNYYMGPEDANSEQCLNWHDTRDRVWRPKCLPLGGTSVWAVAGSAEVVNNNRRAKSSSSNSKRPILMVATGIDSTSMFHDLSPGANSAASNILTLLLAAKLVGSVSDNVLDGLNKRILFGFFQGESYGYVGSRSFLRDVAYPGFQCSNKKLIVPSVSKLGDKSEKACLYPLRPSLEFSNLGEIVGMLAVDQVGLLISDQILYVHNDGKSGGFGQFLSKLLRASATNKFSVSKSSTANNGNGYPYPPSPLTSLLGLSNGNVGGAILTGYDSPFASRALYHSHLDSIQNTQLNFDAIAASATLIARAAVAGAYDSGDMDSDSAALYAANIIPQLSSSDETMQQLINCLFVDGQCDLLAKFASMERTTEQDKTGFIDSGSPYPLGTPPNYYVSVYEGYSGQPFVAVGGDIFGAYNGNNYGKKNSDSVVIRPRLLPMALRGLLNDFLGRDAKSNDDLASCKRTSDCSSVAYCSNQGERAVCSGNNVCVCARAHYHVALDEALEATPGKPTGYFSMQQDEAGNSPLYTEPYWSDVGVRVYRNAGTQSGVLTLVLGLVVGFISFWATFMLRVKMKRDSLY